MAPSCIATYNPSSQIVYTHRDEVGNDEHCDVDGDGCMYRTTVIDWKEELLIQSCCRDGRHILIRLSGAVQSRNRMRHKILGLGLWFIPLTVLRKLDERRLDLNNVCLPIKQTFSAGWGPTYTAVINNSYLRIHHLFLKCQILNSFQFIYCIIFFYGMCWPATDNRSENIWINQIPSQQKKTKQNKTEMKWRLVEWEHIIKRRDGWATCLIVNFRFVDSTLSTSQFDKENRCWWFLRCWILDLRWHRLNHRPWTKYSELREFYHVYHQFYFSPLLSRKKKRRKKNQHYSRMKYVVQVMCKVQVEVMA